MATAAIKAPGTSFELASLERFLYAEAAMLDDCDFEAWLDLFAADGRYWVPAAWQQPDPLNQVSIYYEDRDLLSVRIMRLRHPRTENMRPAPRTCHLVGNVLVRDEDTVRDEVLVSSSQMITEYRLNEQRIFSARCRHRLRMEGDKLKIVEKRVDLLNCDTDAGFVRLTLPF